MAELNFYVSQATINRLFAIKKLQGKDNMTGNEFAAELLENELYRLFPATPQQDEYGNLLNADAYRG